MAQLKGEHQRKCIYCLETKRFSSKKNSGSEFSKEHVINEAFVPDFGGKGQTLFGLVCASCNREFSTSVDVELTQKSPEALLRFINGQKSLRSLRDFRRNNDVIRISTHQPGNVQHGSPAEPLDGKEVLQFGLRTQISFRGKDDRESRHMTINEFIEHGWTEIKGKAVEVSISASSIEELRNINRVMSERQIPFTVISETDGSETRIIPLTAEITLTDLYQRALAKTAFNYLAFTTKDRLPDYIYNDCFKEIRQFIKSGKRPKLTPVEMLKEPEDGMLEKKSGFRHRLSLANAELNGKLLLACDVQLNSGIIWRVYLADDHPRIKLLTGISHVWDCDSHTIIEESNEAEWFTQLAPAMMHYEPIMIILPTPNEVRAYSH